MTMRPNKRPRRSSRKRSANRSKFVSTGVPGLDRILDGGYLDERPVVIRGASGCGKTLFALLFAAGPQNDTAKSPAVFATFDETPEKLRGYMKGWGLKENVTFLDFRPDPDEILSGTEFDLSGMLVRIKHAVQKASARRLVLDTCERLFETFEDNSAQVRRDLFRLFDWCEKEHVTLVATAGENRDYLPSTGALDYASDCTIRLGQKLNNGLMTRFLRVLKRRGYSHGTNEYPFLIDRHGVSVMPVTDTTMIAVAARKRLTTGVAGLDRMLGGKGIWQGSTAMISGQSGTGKSLLAATMAVALCHAGKRVLFCSFEESPEQMSRDVRSIGLDFNALRKSGKLTVLSQRAAEHGIEEHIIRITRLVEEAEPDLVVLDPVSALSDVCEDGAFKSMIIRLCHFLRQAGVTAVLTELLPDDSRSFSQLNMSSLIDTWVRLRRVEKNGSLRRLIYVHKSRGTVTSNNIMEFDISRKGLMVGTPYRPENEATGTSNGE